MSDDAGTGGKAIVDSVAVRMYRRLLGDCFLITVKGHREGDEGEPVASYILIDCGVLQGTAGAGELMREVVEDIYAATGGKPLDLVVVTHEHHDHISGFGLARPVFDAQHQKAKAISQLWFAWTEDPADDDARTYQAKYGHAFATLAKLSEKLKVPTKAAGTSAELLGLAGFSGPLGLDHQAGGKPLRGSRAIYARLREWAGDGNTKYMSPGQVVTTPGDIGLTAYVLGPPRDNDFLTKSLPSSGANSETYLAMAGIGEASGAQSHSPFPPRFHWRSDAEVKAAQQPTCDNDPVHWLYSRYYAQWAACRGAAHKPKEGTACRGDFSRHEPQAYRRIDGTARAAFSNLALRMDNNTNNTSLVVAFELPDDAGVMLFAADAQVGNWLSWEKVEFRTNPKAKPLPLTTASLLARTKLYKVGHHGSHNATLRGKGLELMSDDLVALIPTDAKFALEQSAGWLMPNPRVDEALQAKTRGRVLRGDIPSTKTISEHRKFDSAGAGKFAARITDNKIWVEYQIYSRSGPQEGNA